METSDNGIQLITTFEGLFLKAYDDGTGVWTIGWGTIQYPDGTRVKRGDTCTRDQAVEYLKFELKEKEDGVTDLVNVDLSQQQFDTLVSFTYNLGLGTLKKSTLLSLLNDENYDAVPAEILKFNRAGGKVMAGLTRRRNSEAYLWSTGQLKFDGFKVFVAHARAFFANARVLFKPQNDHPYDVPKHMVRGL